MPNFLTHIGVLVRDVIVFLMLVSSVFSATSVRAQFDNQFLNFVGTSPIVVGEFVEFSVVVRLECSFYGGAQIIATNVSAGVIDIYAGTKGEGTDCISPPPSVFTELLTVVVAGKPAGNYRLNLRYQDGRLTGVRDVIVSPANVSIKVESLIFGRTQRFFLTAKPGDLPALGITGVAPYENTTNGLWPEWARADTGFRAWPASGAAPPSAKSVCRFFNTRVATHFYSANAVDCAALRGLPDWVDEGVAFRAILPQGGVCQSGTEPVYRLFSQSLANHRYTRGVDTYQTFIAYGWTGEGVAFCSPIG